MKLIILNKLKRHLENPQITILLLVIGALLVLIVGFGVILMPVLAGMMIAYLLEGPVQSLERVRVPRLLAVILVFLLFSSVLILIVLGVIPQLSLQISDFVERIPEYTVRIRNGLNILPERYPELISQEQLAYFISELSAQINTAARQIALRSLSGLVNFMTVVVYIFLVPVLVFFFLKDKASIIGWLLRFLPKNRPLVDQIGHVVNVQLSNYIRGKVVEMVIMAGVSALVFHLFKLNYIILLATLVGLSVFIPVVGAIVMTVPVVMVGYLKFGFSHQLMWLTIVYIILQQLDGNVLVPILFSKVNNLHPVAIIAAVLVFGGVWGFWGVFFAIPLATVIQAVLQAWPEEQPDDREQENADIRV